MYIPVSNAKMSHIAGNIRRLLACLLGFVRARLIVIRLTGPLPLVEHYNSPAQEVDHAS